MNNAIKENPFLSKYDRMILSAVEEMGGFVDGHTHFDRCNTINPKYLNHMGIDPIEVGSTLTLKAKQNLTGNLHDGPAYTPANLESRMKSHLNRLIALGTREVTSFIDATPDIGLCAIDCAVNLKKIFAEKIDFKIAVSPIFGFKDPSINSDRWDFYKKAAEIPEVDILGALPEKDDASDRMGFNNHIAEVLFLAGELKKEAHFQLDQANDPAENGTETLIEAVKWYSKKYPFLLGRDDGEPTVWAIHVLSPSCYSEERFSRLVANLVRYNIGVICCPTAALSMRQKRDISAPIHNSVARVLEMAEAGVRIKFGSDNICDVFMPSGRGSILDEIWAFSHAARFYVPLILAKFATGEKLSEIDKDRIRKSLLI